MSPVSAVTLECIPSAINQCSTRCVKFAVKLRSIVLQLIAYIGAVPLVVMLRLTGRLRLLSVITARSHILLDQYHVQDRCGNQLYYVFKNNTRFACGELFSWKRERRSLSLQRYQFILMYLTFTSQKLVKRPHHLDLSKSISLLSWAVHRLAYALSTRLSSQLQWPHLPSVMYFGVTTMSFGCSPQ